MKESSRNPSRSATRKNAPAIDAVLAETESASVLQRQSTDGLQFARNGLNDLISGQKPGEKMLEMRGWLIPKTQKLKTLVSGGLCRDGIWMRRYLISLNAVFV